MKFQDCCVIVLGRNDKVFHTIEQQVAAEYQAGEVVCAHTPIGSNDFITTNSLYDALSGSSLEFVVVVRESELDKAIIEEGFAKFDKEHTSSQKPLLRKGIGTLNFEWYERYDFATAIVVARRVDLFNVLKQQLSPNRKTNLSEGESK